jgi:glutamyl-tRNA reductase
LAAEFGGRAVRFDDCSAALVEADIVVSSTGCPQTILHRADIAPIMPARRNRPLFLVDIAVPRDIDPDVQQLDNVYLYNIDHLEAIVRENMRMREQELSRCHNLIGERVAALMTRLHLGFQRPHGAAIPARPVWELPHAATCHA